MSPPRPFQPTPGCRRLDVVLVRPSRYDDEGYVVRHWRGTLPSNTLSCLNGLVHDAVASGALDPLEVKVHVLDEAVDRVDPPAIARRLARRGAKVLVALAGVQSNQFARATDLARAFKASGCDVMVGGFHVSGSMAVFEGGLPPECQALVEAGVTVVAGEVEERLTGLLQDAASGRLQPVYSFLDAPPDLTNTPLPRCSTRLQRRFAVRHYGTIDAGRGCPFFCSFCTIINVQGRRMRCRNAGQIIDHIREHYRLRRTSGIRNYFFTDDNFARNPQRDAILDGLITLREREGLAIDFMMQVDIAAARIPGLVDRAARAGCVQVFIGIESLREDNLVGAGKRQNRVHTYREAIARWHEAGIICHAGFIIGFPNDTRARIAEDVRMLRDELLVDQASFFMLTPLPGSRDHEQAVRAGVAMDPDLNNFDSFHPVTSHPLMSRDEWLAAYRDAWTSFYSTSHMRAVLLRQNPHTYWGMFKCFLWYRASMAEGAHPMVTGFVRLRDRVSRRPGFPIEGRIGFLARRTRELAAVVRSYVGVAREMRDLWLETRIRRRDYALVADLRARGRRAAARMDIKAAWHDLHSTIAGGTEQAIGRLRRRGRLSAPTLARLAVFRQMRSGPSGDGPPVAGPMPPGPPRRRTKPIDLWTPARDLKNAVGFFVAMIGERF